MSENNPFTEIANDLIMRGEFNELHLLGTFQLVFKNPTLEMWENFKNKPLIESIAERLPNIHLSLAFVIFRRHPEATELFLQYIDHATAHQIKPILIIEFLSFRVNYIPIQWLVHHVTRISETRFAKVLVLETFKNSLKMSPRCIEELHMNDQYWRNYLNYFPGIQYEYPSHAWIKLLKYRTAIREILNFKFDIRLTEYLIINKSDYVKRIITKCTTASKLRSIMRSQLIPFCEANSIDIVTFIISIVCKKDWNVQQKLTFVSNYIQDQNDIRAALEAMTVSSQMEFQKLQDYAKERSIDFTPKPTITPKLTPSASTPLMKSSSIESLPSLSKDPITKPVRLEMWKRSPSIDLSKVKKFEEECSVYSIANGEPNDPVEYAFKLRMLKNMKEIKPIFELAEKFNIVVSYDDFSMMWGKRQLFDKLISEFGDDRFDDICSTLQLSDDEILDFVCSPVDYVCHADKLVEKLEKHVHPSNVHSFFEYIQNYVFQMISKDPISLIIKLFKRGLELSIKFSNGKNLLYYASSIHYINTILEEDAGNEKLETEHFLVLINEPTKIYQIFPPIIQNKTIDEFIMQFTSDELNDIVESVNFIGMAPPEKKIEYLNAAIPKIDGTKYTALLFSYEILNQINKVYDNEIEILQILYESKNVKIDFHMLKKDPLAVLRSAVVVDNIFDILPLAQCFQIPCDDILLTLMIDKMKSKSFSDYQPIVNKIRDSSSVSRLLKLIPRFSNHDQISFLKAIGRFDIKRTKKTMLDLTKLGLNEYAKDELLKDPVQLLTTLYSSIDIQEKLGNKLHKLANVLASRFSFDLFEVQESIIDKFFSEEEIIEFKPVHNSIFEFPPDPQNMQRALFILRKWDLSLAADWLNDYVCDEEKSYFSRSMAIQCWCSISDGDIPENIDIASMYFKGLLERAQVEIPFDLTKEFMLSLLENKNALVYRCVFEYIIYFKITDEKPVIQILEYLLENDLLYILRTIIKLFYEMPYFYQVNRAIEIFIAIISKPIEEIILKKVQWQVAKSQHMAILRYIYNAISLFKIPINSLIIDGKNTEWGEIAERLCNVGAATLAAQLGLHLVIPKHRDDVLLYLMKGSYFDDAIENGFDKDTIFNFIIDGHIEHAAQTLIDLHFMHFTQWLKDRNDTKSIDLVESTLIQQGRTVEAKRMRERLAKSDQPK